MIRETIFAVTLALLATPATASDFCLKHMNGSTELGMCMSAETSVAMFEANGWPAGMPVYQELVINLMTKVIEGDLSEKQFSIFMRRLGIVWPAFHAEMQSRARAGLHDDRGTQQAALIAYMRGDR